MARVINTTYVIFGSLIALFILTVIAIIIAFGMHRTLINDDTLQVSFFDIGQGDSIFIQAPNGTQVLIDGGPDATVLRQLRLGMPLFDKSIDLVIATHPDSDHIAGLVDVLKDYKVMRFIRPAEVKGDSTAWTHLIDELDTEETISALAGMRIILDDSRQIYMDILHPMVESHYGDTNPYSIVARLVYGNTSFLLTGDATREVEHQLVSEYNFEVLDTDVLKLGHHGSKTSSSVEFLRAVSPRVAIISAGKGNKYGHPAPEILAFLNALQIPYLSTQTQGTIIYASDGKNLIRVK